MTICRSLLFVFLATICLPAVAEPGELFPEASGNKRSSPAPGKTAEVFPATPRFTAAQAAAAATRARKMVQDFAGRSKVRLAESSSERFLFFSDLAPREAESVRKSLEAASVSTMQKLAIPYADAPFGGKLAVIVLTHKPSLAALASRNDINVADDAIAYVATTSDQTPAHVALVLAADVREKEDARKGWTQMARAQVAEAILSRHINGRPLPAWVERGFVGLIGNDSPDAPPTGDAALTEVFQDPLRHASECESIVAYLQRRDAKAFADFVRALKNGTREADALQKTFKLDRPALEAAWRRHIADRRGEKKVG